jgi:hypothetical protein
VGIRKMEENKLEKKLWSCSSTFDRNQEVFMVVDEQQKANYLELRALHQEMQIPIIGLKNHYHAGTQSNAYTTLRAIENNDHYLDDLVIVQIQRYKSLKNALNKGEFK